MGTRDEWVGTFGDEGGYWEERPRRKCPNCEKTGHIWRHKNSKGKVDKLYCENCKNYFFKVGKKINIVSGEGKGSHEFVPISSGRGTPKPRKGKFVLDISWSEPGGGKTVPDRGHHEYTEGTEVKCVALPSSGYVFKYWALDGSPVSKKKRCAVIMDDNHTLIARFRRKGGKPIPTPVPSPVTDKDYVTLHINWSPAGGGRTSPDRGHHKIEPGKKVFLIAHPSHEYVFVHWIVNDFIASEFPKIGLTMDNDCTVMAIFEKTRPSPTTPPTTPTTPPTTPTTPPATPPTTPTPTSGCQIIVIAKNDSKIDATGVIVHCSGQTDSTIGGVPGEDEGFTSFSVNNPGRYTLSVTCASGHEVSPKRRSVTASANDIRRGNTKEAGFTLTAEEPEKPRQFNIMGVIPIIILLALGFIISLYTRSWWFFVGFLSWVMVYVLPHPTHWSGSEMEGREWRGLFVPRFRSMYPAGPDNALARRHTGTAFMRSLFKGTAIVCLAFGFQTSTVPLSNLFLVLTVFIGYYSLSIHYSRENPSEYIESFIRFGILGCLLLPYIFFFVFESMVLAVIAWAFFAIPPIRRPKSGEGEEQVVFYEFPLKIIFAVLMLIALVGSGALGAAIGPGTGIGAFLMPSAGWELTGTLSSVFLYFWIVTALAGFFSPAESRPYTGFIMLGAAVIIFALGPGTQAVGQAILGPYWPSFYTGFESVMKPVTELFGQLSQTLGTTFFMLTNPMGYAQSIMNGSYTRDPITGYAGAYGIEIEELKTTPIYIGQPFSVIVKIKNKGFSKAENVTVSISSGYRAPQKERFLPGGESLTIKDIGINESHPVSCPESNLCRQYVDGEINNSLRKLDVRQLFFHSDGITCDIDKQYNLREHFIPINATVEYNYKVFSDLQVEAISAEEWDRRVNENILITQVKKSSEISNAPVRLNIDTLEQPIRDDVRFHIGLYLIPAQKNSEILNASIQLEIPESFGDPAGDCRPNNPSSNIAVNNTRILIWDSIVISKPYIIFCFFDKLDLKNKPTETFLVRANASYRFSRSEIRSTKIEFGGAVCPEEHGPTTIPPEEYIPFIQNVSEEYNLDSHGVDGVSLIKAVIMRESSWRPNVVSSAGAQGLMQIIPGTVNDINNGVYGDCGTITNVFDPEQNINGGTCYLRWLLNHYSYYPVNMHKLRFALAAYNCGQECVDNRISTYGSIFSGVESHLPQETQTYVRAVMDHYEDYKKGIPA